jgi:hypothetical protein
MMTKRFDKNGFYLFINVHVIARLWVVVTTLKRPLISHGIQKGLIEEGSILNILN